MYSQTVVLYFAFNGMEEEGNTVERKSYVLYLQVCGCFTDRLP